MRLSLIPQWKGGSVHSTSALRNWPSFQPQLFGLIKCNLFSLNQMQRTDLCKKLLQLRPKIIAFTPVCRIQKPFEELQHCRLSNCLKAEKNSLKKWAIEWVWSVNNYLNKHKHLQVLATICCPARSFGLRAITKMSYRTHIFYAN